MLVPLGSRPAGEHEEASPNVGVVERAEKPEWRETRDRYGLHEVPGRRRGLDPARRRGLAGEECPDDERESEEKDEIRRSI
jgi:hypothetical protein